LYHDVAGGRGHFKAKYCENAVGDNSKGFDPIPLKFSAIVPYANGLCVYQKLSHVMIMKTFMDIYIFSPFFGPASVEYFFCNFSKNRVRYKFLVHAQAIKIRNNR